MKGRARQNRSHLSKDIFPIATIAPGSGLAAKVLAVWVLIDLGIGPEWVVVGTLRV